MTEGPARIFVPVCKHPRDYQFTFGPLGWVEVDTVSKCPICVEPPDAHKERLEALAECERCRGREFHDCSSACVYWRLTASRAEREAERETVDVRIRRVRLWTGPVAADRQGE